MFSKADDDELMSRLANGEQAAFRGLFERHGARVLGYCCRFMGEKIRGEDQAQEVWMKVIRAAASYRSEGKFSAWLLTVARTTCLTELRRHSTLKEAQFEDEAEADRAVDETATALEKMVTRENLEDLKDAVDALPEMQRVALILWTAGDTSYEEIGRQMDVNEGAVKSLIFRARKTLERQLKGKP